jgi:hypothetical protein
LIRVRVQLTYRLVPYEIEIEASDQTDIAYVLGEGFLAKVIEKIQDFIDGYFQKVEAA